MGRERIIVGFLTVTLIALWAGFVLHRSPRFAGSGLGAILGIAAAFLLLVPLAYAAAKRITWADSRLVSKALLSNLLVWHIYASMAGGILAIFHSGHRFDSILGIALMATMLASILSGYIGRHFLRYVSLELGERETNLQELRAQYADLAKVVALHAHTQGGSLAPQDAQTTHSVLQHRAIAISDAIADLEYAIRADTVIKARLRIWLVVHITASIAFYLLLILHVAAAIQFGLRWLA